MTLKSEISRALDNLRREALVSDYQSRGWDGYDAEPLNKKSAFHAYKLLFKIFERMQVAAPEYIIEPDGDFALYWETPKGQLTVSVSEQGLCSYSAISADESEFLGSFVFQEKLPDIFFDTLEEII